MPLTTFQSIIDIRCNSSLSHMKYAKSNVEFVRLHARDTRGNYNPMRVGGGKTCARIAYVYTHRYIDR